MSPQTSFTEAPPLSFKDRKMSTIKSTLSSEWDQRVDQATGINEEAIAWIRAEGQVRIGLSLEYLWPVPIAQDLPDDSLVRLQTTFGERETLGGQAREVVGTYRLWIDQNEEDDELVWSLTPGPSRASTLSHE